MVSFVTNKSFLYKKICHPFYALYLSRRNILSLSPHSTMVHQSRPSFHSGPLNLSTTTTSNDTYNDLAWPFGKLEGIDYDELCETAYEIFFTSCRSSPGFGGRNALMFYSSHDEDEGNRPGSLSSSEGPGSTGRRANNGAAVKAPTSRVKTALGLKMVKKPRGRRMSMSSFNFSSEGEGIESDSAFSTLRPSSRPMTSAEIMRQQMRVTEESDSRLRKILMRALVGHVAKREETIILPLELIRHIKPSEFNDPHEYHIWQRRQLKILETGLLVHPSIPIEKSNSLAMRLREIISEGDYKPIDNSKSSDTMRTLINTVVSLAWRNPNGSTNVCHYADGFPLNIHLYNCLLRAIFDIRDETVVLDEVDDLLELMKKTWTTFGINRPIHNACFTWVLFQQYVATNQKEPDLLFAAYTMLTEVAKDAKTSDKEAVYVKILSLMLVPIQNWAEKRLLRYHEYFNKLNISVIENLLPLALLSAKILGHDVPFMEGGGSKKGDIMLVDSTTDRVDHYIRSSAKNAFEKMLEIENAKLANTEETEELSVTLLKFAKKTVELVEKEKAVFSRILKRWYPTAAGVAIVTLHQCYGEMLKQHLTGGTCMLNGGIVDALQVASKLEEDLIQMVVEDSEECEDGGRGIVREMMPYEVDSIIMKLLRQWIDERLKNGKDLVCRAKETETWNPKSKSEPYAQSSVELMNLAKKTVKDFFEIPIGIADDLVFDLAEGLEQLFQEYTTFVASCGSKKSYLPTLPPLTRCNRDSKLLKIWKKASPCSVGLEDMHRIVIEGHQSRPSTSRGTQRLYIRLNTLQYLLSDLHSLDKALTISPKLSTTNSPNGRPGCGASYSFFENVNGSIQAACDHVSEVSAYRLIFLDSNPVLYETLYVGDLTCSRIRHATKILKQNLTLLIAIVTERAQPLAMKEVMKASFEAFIMVLLAGGPCRAFNRSDHEMIEEDFNILKKLFCNCGEGMISDDVVQKEAEMVEGVITLMAQSTEQLMEDLSTITCETSGTSVVGTAQKIPIPPTTGRWDRTDPNTILRVLCHRNDQVANQFLKKSFQLAKRK